MKKQIRALLLLLVFALIIPLMGCSVAGDSAKTQVGFDEFLTELFIENITDDAVTLHSTLVNPQAYGIESIDSLLGEISMGSEPETAKYYQGLKDTLHSFDYDLLTTSQKLSYDILDELITRELKAKDLYMFDQGFHPSGGIQSYLPAILGEYEFREEKDIDKYLEIVGDIDRYYADIIKFEKEKIKLGTFMSDKLVDMLIKECEDYISKKDDNVLISTFDSRIEKFPGLSDAKKQEYINRNKDIVLNEVIPAYQNVIDEFTAMKGSGKNNGGLANYVDGKRYYEYLFERKTGSRSSVSKMAKSLEAGIITEIMALQKIISENPDYLDLYDDYEFVIQDPMDIMEYLEEVTAIDFPPLKNINYDVKYVDESLRDSLAPAFYLTPPVDDFSSSVIYVNVRDDEELKTIFPTVAHEGYPGHLYQISYFYGSDAHEFRKVLSFNGYTEGWATYAESYSYDFVGLEVEFGDLLDIERRISIYLMCRVDIGIHYEGWTKDQMREYVATYLGDLDDETIDNLYYTTIADPGNPLSYGVGYIEINSLMQAAKKKLSNDFDLKEFHTFLLDVGPASFNIVEKEMNKWLKTKK